MDEWGAKVHLFVTLTCFLIFFFHTTRSEGGRGSEVLLYLLALDRHEPLFPMEVSSSCLFLFYLNTFNLLHSFVPSLSYIFYFAVIVIQ